MGYRIAIVGAGAIGGFYGARLQKAGNEVHFLLRSDYEHVAEKGLRVDSCQGDFILPHVHAHCSVETMPTCDLIIVGLKVTANGILPKVLPPLMKKDGVVLTLQNGMGADDQIARIVGSDRVMGGLCFICSNKVGPGYIRHLDFGSITLGDYAPNFGKSGMTPRLGKITALLRSAGLEIQPIEDLFLGRWRKLVWNIPYNGMSVIMDATTDVMVKNPALRILFRELMEEVAKGAAAYGREIPEAFIRQMIDYTDRMMPYATSMMLDYQRKHKMEVEAIYGEPLRLAADKGVAMPHIETMYRQLSFINSLR